MGSEATIAVSILLFSVVIIPLGVLLAFYKNKIVAAISGLVLASVPILVFRLASMFINNIPDIEVRNLVTRTAIVNMFDTLYYISIWVWITALAGTIIYTLYVTWLFLTSTGMERQRFQQKRQKESQRRAS